MPARLLSWLCLPLLWLAAWAFAAEGDVQAVPTLSTPVTDTAGLLDEQQRLALVDKILAFEKKQGSQVAVLIVPTTQPEDIFSYSFRVADAWKLGRKGVDDGVLLVVAVKDKKTHIQVGYGLEGAIPDITAKQILQDMIRPQFRQGDFYGGINVGLDAIMKAASGEALPPPKARSDGGLSGDKNPLPALVIAVVIGLFVRSIIGRVFGSLLGGGIAAGTALAFGIPLLFSIFLGIFALLAVATLSTRGGGGGGFGGGSFGGGSSSSSSSSWGGGGGSFGGGGASGDW